MVRAGRACALAAAGAALLAACAHPAREAPDPLANASTSTTAPLPNPVGPRDCQPMSENHPRAGSTEIHGSAALGTQVWALVPGSLPLEANSVVQIRWSMNGAARLRLTAVAPDGTVSEPSQLFLSAGPGWDRPGSTWASVFTFARTGCWRIVAERGDRHGDVWLEVG